MYLEKSIDLQFGMVGVVMIVIKVQFLGHGLDWTGDIQVIRYDIIRTRTIQTKERRQKIVIKMKTVI